MTSTETTSRELRVSHLIGRVVHDVDGRKVGRIEELLATIELHEWGNEYIVAEFHVGAYALLEAYTGSRFGQKFLQRIAPLVGYRLLRIPWDWMDLSDPEHPCVRRRRAELEASRTPVAGA